VDFSSTFVNLWSLNYICWFKDLSSRFVDFWSLSSRFVDLLEL